MADEAIFSLWNYGFLLNVACRYRLTISSNPQSEYSECQNDFRTAALWATRVRNCKILPVSLSFLSVTAISHLISNRVHSVGKSTVALKVSKLIEQRNSSEECTSILYTTLEFDKIETDRGTFSSCCPFKNITINGHDDDIFNLLFFRFMG